MLKSAKVANEDAYKKAITPPTVLTAANIKKKGEIWMAAFFRSLNPANWFNEFSNIKITLEEFDSVKKNQPGRGVSLTKDRNYKNTYIKTHKATRMKNISKTSVFMALILPPVSLYAGIASQPGDEQNFRKQPGQAVILKNTPVYEGDTNHQVAILEIDYPKVAANFSAAFPAAGKQLWLKEGNSLFVYFSNMGKRVTAVFTVKGRMNYSVSIIGLSEVPEIIRNKIKKEYGTFSFFNAKQIQAGGYISYELVFENCREYVAITTTDNDEIVETAKIRKTTNYENCADKTQ